MRNPLAALQDEAAPLDPALLAVALAREADHRFAAFLDGIEAYRDHPYRRNVPAPAAVWREGATQLLFYKSPSQGRTGNRRLNSKTSVPIVVVPSLINKSYILDLDTETSLLRFLSRQGHPTYLVDWGKPGPKELKFTLEDYIAGRLHRSIEEVVAREGRPPVLLGYCMGGLLTLPISLLRPDLIVGMSLLATPWDFHAEGITRLGAFLKGFEAAIAGVGELPIDLIQSMFFALDPLLVVRKFVRFGSLNPTSKQAYQFVAVEDWLNDGVALAGPVAQTCLHDWYGSNAPAKRMATRILLSILGK
ncbi:MAG: alpha/beta fold hydrolase [Alphaproteobacteria bacterium]